MDGRTSVRHLGVMIALGLFALVQVGRGKRIWASTSWRTTVQLSFKERLPLTKRQGARTERLQGRPFRSFRRDKILIRLREHEGVAEKSWKRSSRPFHRAFRSGRTTEIGRHREDLQKTRFCHYLRSSRSSSTSPSALSSSRRGSPIATVHDGVRRARIFFLLNKEINPPYRHGASDPADIH